MITKQDLIEVMRAEMSRRYYGRKNRLPSCDQQIPLRLKKSEAWEPKVVTRVNRSRRLVDRILRGLPCFDHL